MIRREVLRADGYTEEEIEAIDQYCMREDGAGRFDNTATPVLLNGKLVLVCRTVADALLSNTLPAGS